MKTTSNIILCLGLLFNCRVITGFWTGWYDRDNPGGSGDWELRSLLDPIPCGGATPKYIEAREVWGTGYRWMLRTYNYIKIGPRYGLTCQNNKNLWTGLPYPQCKDYSVNYLGPSAPYSPTFDVDDPTVTGDWELAVQVPWNTAATYFYFRTVPASPVYGYRITRIIRVGAKYGLSCLNTDNTAVGLGLCGDYQVRFYCPPFIAAATKILAV